MNPTASRNYTTVLPIKQCQQFEFDAVFTAEGVGNDALTPLGHVAAITERMTLGTHIATATARPPTVLAQGLLTVDAMAGGGRIIAGVGGGFPGVSEGWHVAVIEYLDSLQASRRPKTSQHAAVATCALKTHSYLAEDEALEHPRKAMLGRGTSRWMNYGDEVIRRTMVSDRTSASTTTESPAAATERCGTGPAVGVGVAGLPPDVRQLPHAEFTDGPRCPRVGP